jgi:uncharacterized protein (TIGR03437 family)
MATHLSAFGRFGVERSSAGGYLSPLKATFSYPQELTVEYQTGTPDPASRTIRSSQLPNIQEVAVKVDAGSWLQVTSRKDAYFVEHTLNFNPTGLAPGKYIGTITVTPVVTSDLIGFPVVSSTFRVNLNISALPTLQFERGVDAPVNGAQLSPASWKISSNGTPAAFTARIASTEGGNWLSMDKTSGTTPDTLTFSANATGLARGIYAATIVVEGPKGPQETQVYLNVNPGVPTPLTAFPTTRTYVRESGAPADEVAANTAQFTSVPPALTGIKATTTDGGNWLILSGNANAGGQTSVAFRFDASGLSPGTYTGAIVATRGNETASSQVVLTVLPKPTSPLVPSPTSFVLTAKAGQMTAPQTISVSSPDGVVLFSAQSEAGQITVSDLLLSPTPKVVTFTALYDIPGTYQNAIVLTTSAGTVKVPVALYVTATADQPPIISSITSSASNVSGKIAPGELITLRGPGIGPARTGLTLDASGRITTEINPDTRVLLNDVPAPILYASPEQWNVIVPYEVNGTSATVKVLSGGIESKPWTIPVAPSAPGVFTIGSTGVGPGAVLNQDNTVNGPSNPAAKGTILQIYATGAGQSIATATTGSVTPPTGGGQAIMPIKVRLDGYNAPVTFAGPAPGFASGVLQVNAVIPPEVFGRANVPLILDIDGALSQTKVTVSIR